MFLFKTPLLSILDGSCTAALTTPLMLEEFPVEDLEVLKKESGMLKFVHEF